MTTASAIILRGFGGVPEVTPDAYELKKSALAAAKPIKKVETEGELKAAVAALRELKAIRTGIESTRKSVKAPVLELGKKIDNVANDFVAETDKEESRIQGLINHFQRVQMEAARKEQARLEAEQAEAARLEAEAARKREEAERAVDPKDKERANQEATQLEATALDKALSAELSGGAVVVAKPRGLVVKNRLNFTVKDPHVFCQAHPEFWTWHAETETLKLKRREILEELNREDGRGVFHRTQFPEELPAEKGSQLVRPAGLEVFEETKSHVR